MNPGHTWVELQRVHAVGALPNVPGAHPAQPRLSGDSHNGGRHTSGTQSAAELGGVTEAGWKPGAHVYAPATQSRLVAAPVEAVVVPAGHGTHAAWLLEPRLEL